MSEPTEYLTTFDPTRNDHLVLLKDAARQCELGAYGVILRMRKWHGIELDEDTATDALRAWGAS